MYKGSGTRALRQLRSVGLAGAAIGLLFVACDRQAERTQSARTLWTAALDQVLGTRSGGSALLRAKVEDRAISGELEGVARALFSPPTPRFAIGSIVCKPKDFDHFQAEFEGSPSQATTSVPEATSQQNDAVQERNSGPAPSQPFGLRATKPPPLAFKPRPTMAPRALEVQAAARSRMIATMEKFGLSGDVAMSRTRAGQMVIQLGEDAIDPTQFDGAPGASIDAMMADDSASLICPENPDVSQMATNRALATKCVIDELRASGEFEYVEIDYIFEHQFARRPAGLSQTGMAAPNDPLWEMQWHFQDYGEGAEQSPGGTSFQSFWSRAAQTGSSEVVVAVVDTGLALNHPDIVDSPNVAPGWDMVSDPRMGNDGDGRDSDPNDPGDICNENDPLAENSFHGTHVSGIIGAAATDNGAGVAGGAWQVTLVPVRALGKCGGRLSDINDAIRWAGGLIPAIDDQGGEVWNDNPADIINLSIGLLQTCPASLQDAIDSVVERGAVVVAAAGNAQLSTAFYAPGGCQNVISVAASDARGHITPYSNFGVEVDIIAPGGDLSRDDNGDSRPDGVLSTRPSVQCYDPVTGQDVETCYYAYEQGTSMAAPHVSAAFALTKASYPQMTGPELTALVLSSLRPRLPEQCAGPCAQYPGTEPIAGSEGLCRLPCGGGLLDLDAIARRDDRSTGEP